MRRSLIVPVVLSAVLAACGEEERALAPAIADVSSYDADRTVALLDRAEILRDAVEFDAAPVGRGIDFAETPKEFALEFDAGEGVGGTDGGTVDTAAAGCSNYAAGVIAAWAANVITTSVVLPPAIGIGLVSQGTITQIDTNVWQAVRTVPLGGQDVTGTFTVAWVGIGWLAEMRLTTADGAWTDDVWFNGFLGFEGGVGWWDLYDRGALVGVVEWLADGQGNAQIGLAAVAGEHAGSALGYVFAASGFARIDATDGATHAWVQVNPDHSGEISHPQHAGGVRSCWAPDFTNSACAE